MSTRRCANTSLGTCSPPHLLMQGETSWTARPRLQLEHGNPACLLMRVESKYMTSMVKRVEKYTQSEHPQEVWLEEPRPWYAISITGVEDQ